MGKLCSQSSFRSVALLGSMFILADGFFRFSGYTFNSDRQSALQQCRSKSDYPSDLSLRLVHSPFLPPFFFHVCNMDRSDLPPFSLRFLTTHSPTIRKFVAVEDLLQVKARLQDEVIKVRSSMVKYHVALMGARHPLKLFMAQEAS